MFSINLQGAKEKKPELKTLLLPAHLINLLMGKI